MNRKPKPQQLTYKSSIKSNNNHIDLKLKNLKDQISLKKQIHSTLHTFMQKIVMQQHLPILMQSGIDSLEILKEAKQSQLEEIGIPKGHVLKILAALSKEFKANESEKLEKSMEIKEKKSVNLIKQEKTVDTLNNNTIDKGYSDVEINSIPIQRQAQIFCLFCYKRSPYKFCNSNCEYQYDKMFEKYQKNVESQLLLAQQMKEQEDVDEKEQEFGIQILDIGMNEDSFDQQHYNKIRSLIDQ